jgi:hypothetical protein
MAARWHFSDGMYTAHVVYELWPHPRYCLDLSLSNLPCGFGLDELHDLGVDEVEVDSLDELVEKLDQWCGGAGDCCVISLMPGRVSGTGSDSQSADAEPVSIPAAPAGELVAALDFRFRPSSRRAELAAMLARLKRCRESALYFAVGRRRRFVPVRGGIRLS